MNKLLAYGIMGISIALVLVISIIGGNILNANAQATPEVFWDNPVTIPENQVIYGSATNYQFKLDWAKNSTPTNVLMGHDFYEIGTLEEITNIIGNTYIITTQNLPVGTYYWYVKGTDENEIERISDTYTYEIQKATPIIYLWLNDQDGDLVFNESAEVKVSAEGTDKNQQTIELFINDALLGYDSSPPYIVGENHSFSEGINNITVRVNESQNYTARQILTTVTILSPTNQTNTSTNITTNTTMNITENTTNITNTTNTTEQIQNGGINWQNPITIPEDQIIYGTATNYQFKVDWTVDNMTSIDYVKIKHDFNGEEQIEDILNVQNQSYIHTQQTLSAATYNWMMFANTTNGTKNQTNNFTYTVQKASPQIYLYLNLEESDISTDNSSIVNITGITTPEIFDETELLINGEPQQPVRNSIESIFDLSKKFNEVGIYNITVKFNGSQNYTAYQISRKINVTQPTLRLTSSSTQYAIGELAGYSVYFPEYSNVEVEICGPIPKDESGFVECYDQTTISNMQSPHARTHSHTDKIGKYIINAQTNHNGLVLTSNDNYTVINSISISVSGDAAILKEEETNLQMSVAGGISPYTYKWILSNGTIIQGQNLIVSYNTPGTYPINASVFDSKGNNNSYLFNIVVQNGYDVIVYVKNTDNNEPIESALVEFGKYSQWTDSEGKATFFLPKDEYELEISADNYKTWTQNKLKIDSDRTNTYKLSVKEPGEEFVDNSPIKLIAPISNAKINSETITFKTNIALEEKATCYLYLTEEGNFWSKQLKEFEVTKDTIIEHTEDVSLDKKYSWYVECEGESDTETSLVYKFSTTSNAKEATENEEEKQTAISSSAITLDTGVIDAGELRRKLEEAINNIGTLDFDSKQAADDMGLGDILQKKLKDYDRIIRDINNIKFRGDLSDIDKDAKLEEYKQNLKDIELKTPILIKVDKSEEFIVYPKKEELRIVATEYAEEEKIDTVINENYLLDIQNKIIVKTKISHATLTLIDGTIQEITLIRKLITYSEDLDEREYLLEYISKDLAENSKDITFLNDMTIIKPDPIIKYDQEDKIVYYVENHKDFELAKLLYTVVFSEKVFQGGSNPITGRTILSDIDLTSPIGLIILLVIAILIYLAYAYDVFHKAKYFALSLFNKKALEKINSLIADANDYVTSGELERANLLFKELKLLYERSKQKVREEVYKDAYQVLVNINQAFFEKLFNEVEKDNEENKQDADKIQKMLFAYNELDDNTKTNFQALVPKYIEIYNSLRGTQ